MVVYFGNRIVLILGVVCSHAEVPSNLVAAFTQSIAENIAEG